MARGMAIAGSVAAFAAIASQAPAQQPIALPPLHVQAPDTDSCVDVEVGGAKSLSFDCLNRQLHNPAGTDDSKAPDIAAKDVTGSGAPTTAGTFSYTGTAIRMGDAFGKSAIPQRPTPPSFTGSLVPHVPGAR